MSESVEMYLVMTALLRRDSRQPVPISMLAGKLAVSAVSANEMCRKLDERGLVAYQPYKGVTLTAAGEVLAQEVLSRRRLWVVFLVENLGIDPQEADDLACQLEHITSDRLVNALRSFLEHAPLRAAANSDDAQATPDEVALPLAGCSAGTRGRVADISAEPVIARFLRAQGVQPDVPIEVLAVGGDGTILLGLAGRHVALAPTVAAQVSVFPLSDEPSPRQRTWARCSDFWACLQSGQAACAGKPQLEAQPVT